MAKIERIRFLRPMAGPRLNWRVGDKVSVGDRMDEETAARLVEAGYAEVLRGDAIETAEVGPDENAAQRTSRPKSKSKKTKGKKKS